MPKVQAATTGIEVDGSAVVLSLTIDGRRRRFVLTATDALLVGNRLANCGADILPAPAGLPRIENVRIRTFDERGQALLQIESRDLGGPATFAIDHHWLQALASGADAALEHTRPGGRA